MRKLFSWTITLLIVALCFSAAYAEPSIEGIDAPSYILMDLKSGRVLCGKNEGERMYPASTTKIMTAIIALENGKLDQLMTANEKNIDPGPGGMNVGIMAGEQLTMEALLHALLMKSANESANIIAENLCPTRQDFLDLMNKKAKELGAYNTHFVTTNGMHDDDHYTTVHDMAKIAFYAMKLEKFREIVSKPKYDMESTNKHEKWDTFYTTNRLISMYSESDYFSSVLGIKTGYTSQAGNNLVSAAENDKGMQLMAVMFGVKNNVNASNVYIQSRRLLEYGFQNFSEAVIANANEVVKTVAVEDAKDDAKLPLISESGLSAVMPSDNALWNLNIKQSFVSDSFKAPISKGEVLGHIEYENDGVSLGRVNIIAANDVEKSFIAELKQSVYSFLGGTFKKIILSIAGVIIFFILLRIVLRRISRAVNSRKI